MSATRAAPALLPCPFCGGAADYCVVRYDAATVRELKLPQGDRYSVSCTVCGVDNGSLSDEGVVGFVALPTAAAKWNRRFPQVGAAAASDADDQES